ncbi:hypothetical protein [Sulfurihydrogenibium sp.]|uniref:hypothetical protein n=1 Tax=Sulfurihydrogenibium sp. TaxID=2053621 RepID=UPI003D0E2215
MRKLLYTLLIIALGIYIIQNLPFKSVEDFRSYIYSGKHVEDKSSLKNEGNKNKNDSEINNEEEKPNIDLSQKEKEKELNKVLGIEEEKKEKSFGDKLIEKYVEFKQKIENFIDNIKMFITNKSEKEEK